MMVSHHHQHHRHSTFLRKPIPPPTIAVHQQQEHQEQQQHQNHHHQSAIGNYSGYGSTADADAEAAPVPPPLLALPRRNPSRSHSNEPLLTGRAAAASRRRSQSFSDAISPSIPISTGVADATASTKDHPNHLEVDQENNTTEHHHHHHGDPHSSSLHRHLSLLDLILVGIGGTVGSGLFVLAGLVAHQYAGPSAVLSWAIAGFAACLSGCCYAELASRIPLPGSAYAYVYVAIGEYPAIVAATCLSLEYIFACAAVARSWGDKVITYLVQQNGWESNTENYGWTAWLVDLADGQSSGFNPFAFLIAAAIVALLLSGIKESKLTSNAFTFLKLALVVFMIVVSCSQTEPQNWSPFLLHGWSGVFRGATTTFFGYLGYDQLCCMAGEAENPKRDLPLATMFTLMFVALIYMLATLGLTGMLPSDKISTVSGFPSAFFSLDMNYAAQITAIGEIVTLPIVVLITTMVQPRLQFAMSTDGLLPRWFAKLDANGNMWNGLLFGGASMTFIATFVPFTHLNDIISCGALSALTLTDTSLLYIWHYDDSSSHRHLFCWLVLLFHLSCFCTSMAVMHLAESSVGQVATMVGTACSLFSVLGIYFCCPRSSVFGGVRGEQSYRDNNNRVDDGYFRTPFLPFWPCAAIFINWYLIAQLEMEGLLGFLGVVALASLYYFWFTGQLHRTGIGHHGSHSHHHGTQPNYQGLTKAVLHGDYRSKNRDDSSVSDSDAVSLPSSDDSDHLPIQELPPTPSTLPHSDLVDSATRTTASSAD